MEINHEIVIEEIVEINKLLNNKNSTIIDGNRLNSIVASFHYYDNVRHQVCSIVRSIAKNHAFIDANKRTALVTLVLYSEKLGLQIKLSDDEMFNVIQEISTTDISVERMSTKIFK